MPCFNPRTRDGCEALREQGISLNPRFNPRTRDGCESARSFAYVSLDVSIHAPVMGVKSYQRILNANKIVSIHAPVMGANKHAP